MLIKIKYGRYTNRRIRAHESGSEVTVRRLDKIIQRIFFLNQEPAFAESLGNGLERLVSQGLFYLYRKLSQLRFLPGLLRFAPTNCPWVSEDECPGTARTARKLDRLFTLFRRHGPLRNEYKFDSLIFIACKFI